MYCTLLKYELIYNNYALVLILSINLYHVEVRICYSLTFLWNYGAHCCDVMVYKLVYITQTISTTEWITDNVSATKLNSISNQAIEYDLCHNVHLVFCIRAFLFTI